MRDKDIFSTLIEKNKEVIEKKNAVHNNILKRKISISDETAHFNLMKQRNSNIHEERIKQIKNTLHR